MERSRRNNLLYTSLLIASLLVSLGCLAFPIYIIRPFRHQGPRELAAALNFIHARAFIEPICAVLALAGLGWYWQVQQRRPWRILAVTGTFFVCAFAVLSFVNVYELMFHPVAHPAFAAAHQVKLDPEERVIAVKLNGNARAYPIRSIAYHHVVNDVVGQIAIVATY
jgi:Protein of unknown function (DUF3179)